MVTTKSNKARLVDCIDEKEPGGSCRHYKASTAGTVKRASLTVGELFSISIPEPSFKAETCLGVYKEAKKYLSTDISEQPEIQLAFQSIKKLLPDACECMHGSMLEDLHSRLSRPPPKLPPGYSAFCRKIVKEIFPSGWDRGWDSAKNTFSPSLGSCIGRSRRGGGQLSSLAEKGQEAWLSGFDTARCNLKGELLLVNSSGKPRSLTRFESDSSYLRPLHSMIYDQLSRQSWLLRGDVTSDKLREAGFHGFGTTSLISGDYVSASDNLPIEIAELILDVIWSSSKYIPSSLFRYALAAQRPELAYEGPDHLLESFTPTIGQMMGSYLCFPLLCLQNYLAFRWAEFTAGVSSTPVLINGDDILFEQDNKFYNHWVSVIVEVGFEVEHTKTSVSSDWGTINSTLLRRKGGNLVPIRTFRMGMLRRQRHPGCLGDSFEKFSKVGPKGKWLRNGIIFLRWHAYLLKWGCVAQDMRFFGSLAKQSFRYAFGGALWSREAVLRGLSVPSLEPAPCPHNVVMRGNEFETFSEVPQKVVKGIGRWMAARKWELGGVFKPEKIPKMLARAQSNVCSAGLSKSWLNFKGMKSNFKKPLYHYLSDRYEGRIEGRRYSPKGVAFRTLGGSYWTRPTKTVGIRVPKPLVEEFGLLPETVGVDSVLDTEWGDIDRYGIGAFLYSNMMVSPVRPCLTSL